MNLFINTLTQIKGLLANFKIRSAQDSEHIHGQFLQDLFLLRRVLQCH